MLRQIPRGVLVKQVLMAAMMLLVSTADAHARLDPTDGAAGDRITMQVVQSAKFVFPLRVLSIERVRYPDGTLLYAIRLDARGVLGASAPIITSQIRLAAGARMDVIERALREASAKVVLLLEQMRSRGPRDWNLPPPHLGPSR